MIGILIVYYFKKDIQLDETNNDSRPSLIGGWLFTSTGLGLRMLFDYQIMDLTAWIYGLIVAAVITTLLVKVSKDKVKFFIPVAFCVIFLAYGYGSIVMINCYYDTIPPEKFSTYVKSKRVQTYSHIPVHMIKLLPWEGQTETFDATVPIFLYNSINPGSRVTVYQKQGYLNIPWFYVEAYKTESPPPEKRRNTVKILGRVIH